MFNVMQSGVASAGAGFDLLTPEEPADDQAAARRAAAAAAFETWLS